MPLLQLTPGTFFLFHGDLFVFLSRDDAAGIGTVQQLANVRGEYTPGERVQRWPLWAVIDRCEFRIV